MPDRYGWLFSLCKMLSRHWIPLEPIFRLLFRFRNDHQSLGKNFEI